MGMALLLFTLKADRIATIPVVLGQEILQETHTKKKKKKTASEYTCDISLMHLNPGDFVSFTLFLCALGLSLFLYTRPVQSVFLFTGPG